MADLFPLVPERAFSGRHRVPASTADVSCSACQVQGSNRSSSWALVRPETTRSSTSVSHARGSTPLSFAVATRLVTIAQGHAPPSEPANRLFLRPLTTPRIIRSYKTSRPYPAPSAGAHRERVPSGRFVRLRMLDRGVRLTAA